ncbi:UPF0587 protein like [Heracleum sosnowskyi]|uniref:UPF0587 protein like n=1 Tax=Heracleum sosnowskyi TaxID=360622 RepID=A0AAD8MD47_9APIA|nr:UPF0587 protein like [Heracleum sosnowskyi]
MVKYRLMFTAEMQNIKTLQPARGISDPGFNYYIKMKCGSCGELTKKDISVNSKKKVSASWNSPNLVMKCKYCEKVGTVTVISGTGKPLTQELSERGKSAPLMELDCKGYEPVEFMFGSGWKAESIAGTKFEDIDLSDDGEFAEYDEKGGCPVTIYNLHATFDVLMSDFKEMLFAYEIRKLERVRWEVEQRRAKKEENEFHQ